MSASNLTVRLATAGVLVPLILALLFAGPPWGWLLFLLAVTVIAALELFGMTHAGDRAAQAAGVTLTLVAVLAIWFAPSEPRVLVAAVVLMPFASVAIALWRLGDLSTAALRLAVTVFGPWWLGAGIGSIALLRVSAGSDGAAYVVLSLVCAWMSDTGGFFVGRAWGRRKLYPAVSPGKTWEGVGGGLLGSVIGALVLRALVLRALPVSHVLALAVGCGLLGMVGDLGESLLKRSVGVKDSGGILPGHGGMLDRIDAVLVTAPVILLYVQWLR
jgi:phosphatidate cytidylyltransferase